MRRCGGHRKSAPPGTLPVRMCISASQNAPATNWSPARPKSTATINENRTEGGATSVTGVLRGEKYSHQIENTTRPIATLENMSACQNNKLVNTLTSRISNTINKTAFIIADI